jgi:raffinose/stachyose/melibiose transport system permease protein
MKKSVVNKRTPGESVVLWVLCALFTLYAFTLLYPVFWMVISSFKTPSDLFRNIYKLPQKWVFKNYADAFLIKVNGVGILGMFVNNVLVSVSGLLLALFSSSLAAYTLSKYPFKGSRFIYSFMIVIMLLPFSASTAALYRFMKVTALYGTRLGLVILYGGGFGYAFLLLYNFYVSVSWSYAESAMIDGASDFKVFLYVMFPQSLPMLLAVGIISFMGLWGDYTNVYLYMPNNPTLAFGIKLISDNMQSEGNWPASFAAMLISTVPVGIFYLFANSKLYKSKIDTGIKG